MGAPEKVHVNLDFSFRFLLFFLHLFRFFLFLLDQNNFLFHNFFILWLDFLFGVLNFRFFWCFLLWAAVAQKLGIVVQIKDFWFPIFFTGIFIFKILLIQIFLLKLIIKPFWRVDFHFLNFNFFISKAELIIVISLILRFEFRNFLRCEMLDLLLRLRNILAVCV